MMKKECIDRFDAIGCNAAYSFCQEQISTPFWNAGLNVCLSHFFYFSLYITDVTFTICSPMTSHSPARSRSSLMVSATAPSPRRLTSTSICLMSVLCSAFRLRSARSSLARVRLDSHSTERATSFLRPGASRSDTTSTRAYANSRARFYVAALLEHGVDVLAYVGKFDWSLSIFCRHLRDFPKLTSRCVSQSAMPPVTRSGPRLFSGLVTTLSTTRPSVIGTSRGRWRGRQGMPTDSPVRPVSSHAPQGLALIKKHFSPYRQ
jgi:hypothetical protein